MNLDDTYIPMHILRDHTLPSGARLLYGVILTRSLEAGYCSSTNKELGDDVCVSSKRVQEYIAALIKHGLIRREVGFNLENGAAIERRLYPMEVELKNLAAWIEETGGSYEN